MPRKKKTVSFAERMLKLYRSGLPKKLPPPADTGELPSLDDRVKQILGIAGHKHNNLRMLFFVMYDIEDNRVRSQVVKYLLKKGCSRIQKSIFLGDAEHAVYAQIKDDLAAVQECYENHDSIILVPISTDYLQAMRIIGKNIDVDVILKNKNTLFF
ncbi:MAG: CRISPR-associated endonuclease Cas2 [Dysgonamonadaceae bacterium]|jgi:CRISPR-associated protein Cas2|nr:CRISPR-associated endonuclease Cas2 [Dysgonamonadaceae bacterium]